MRQPGLLLVLCIATGCASDASPVAPPRSAPLTLPDGGTCGPHEFLYDDVSCPNPGAALHSDAGQCVQEGDSLCHQRCSSDADCTDPTRRYCRVLGLFASYDSNCNVGVRICRERDADDCNPSSLDLR